MLSTTLMVGPGIVQGGIEEDCWQCVVTAMNTTNSAIAWVPLHVDRMRVG